MSKLADEAHQRWYESENDTAQHSGDGYAHIAKRVGLTFGAIFKTPPVQPKNSLAIGFRIRRIRVGSIGRHGYEYVVRW